MRKHIHLTLRQRMLLFFSTSLRSNHALFVDFLFFCVNPDFCAEHIPARHKHNTTLAWSLHKMHVMCTHQHETRCVCTAQTSIRIAWHLTFTLLSPQLFCVMRTLSLSFSFLRFSSRSFSLAYKNPLSLSHITPYKGLTHQTKGNECDFMCRVE